MFEGEGSGLRANLFQLTVNFAFEESEYKLLNWSKQWKRVEVILIKEHLVFSGKRPTMSITSDEVNFLVYRYLLESGTATGIAFLTCRN